MRSIPRLSAITLGLLTSALLERHHGLFDAAVLALGVFLLELLFALDCQTTFVDRQLYLVL